MKTTVLSPVVRVCSPDRVDSLTAPRAVRYLQFSERSAIHCTKMQGVCFPVASNHNDYSIR
jgi:hypothetical protein